MPGSLRLRLPTVDGLLVLQVSYAAAMSADVGGNLSGLVTGQYGPKGNDGERSHLL